MMSGQPVSPARPTLAIVLPRKEGFGPDRAGAVALVIHQLCQIPDNNEQQAMPTVVIGGPQDGPLFPGIAYRSALGLRWLPISSSLRHAWAVGRQIRQLRPALIEVHNRPGIAISLARQFPRTPVMLVLHNDPRSRRDLEGARARTRLLSQLAHIVCVSDYIRNRLIEDVNPTIARRATVLRNAVDLATLPPPPAVREPLILYAGRVVRDKGVDSFTTACALALPDLPGWRAEIIGGHRFGPNSPETDFIRDIRAQADRAGISMPGYQPREMVLAAMRRAAIVVVPSRWPDPCPLVVVEAMASGAALIATERGGVPELGGNAAIYVDPDDPAAIAVALRDLAANPVRLEAVRHACLERAKLFDLPDAKRRWTDLRHALIPATWSPSDARTNP